MESLTQYALERKKNFVDQVFILLERDAKPGMSGFCYEGHKRELLYMLTQSLSRDKELFNLVSEALNLVKHGETLNLN